MYNDIKSFPFAEYANSADIEQLATKHRLINYNSWMLPQLLAHFGQFRVKSRTIADIMQDNVGRDSWSIGVWRVVMQLRRSLLVKSQVANPEYSQLTPLILAGLKKYQNISYSSWQHQPDLHMIMEPKLLEAARSVAPVLDSNTLLAIRQQGLTIKSGQRAGSLLSSTSTWSLRGIADTPIGHLPVLAQTVLCQIWTAHPSIRSQYAVLCSHNWDVMPDALIATELTTSPLTELNNQNSRLPWL